MPFDYSQTADPKDFSQPVPDGTLATVQMRIRPGGVGEDNLLKRTASARPRCSTANSSSSTASS